VSSINSGSILLAGAPNTLITNISVAAPAVEVSHTLQNNVSVLEFKVREDDISLQWCFDDGETDTTFITLPPCSSQSFSGIKLVNKTIYFRSSAPCIIEIIEFYS
jgi:hypothetical protein